MVYRSVSPVCNDHSINPSLLPRSIWLKERIGVLALFECLRSATEPGSQHLKSFSEQARRLLREWEKLTLDDDGILCHKTAVRTQLIKI